MSTEPLRVERRRNQRFNVNLPVSISLAESSVEGYGFTQDLSARGVLLFTDFSLAEGDAVELTLQMPSEITLGESMRVRCFGRVKRIVPPAGGAARGVAVFFEKYEYLQESADTKSSSARTSTASQIEVRPVLHS